MAILRASSEGFSRIAAAVLVVRHKHGHRHRRVVAVVRTNYMDRVRFEGRPFGLLVANDTSTAGGGCFCDTFFYQKQFREIVYGCFSILGLW